MRNEENFKRCKDHTATKILFLMLVSTLFLLPLVSAWEFDNVLRYEENDMKVRIKNAFGLGEELGTATLKSHKSVDEVLYIPMGKDRAVMEYEFINWELYKDGLGKVYFTNMTSGKSVIKDYYFAEKIVYEECKEIGSALNGSLKTICKEKVRWEKLKTKDILGNITIGLITDVEFGDHFDAVWTIAGKKISRHAEWDYVDTIDLTGEITGEITGIAMDGDYFLIGNGSHVNKHFKNKTYAGLRFPRGSAGGLASDSTYYYHPNDGAEKIVIYWLNGTDTTEYFSNPTGISAAYPSACDHDGDYMWVLQIEAGLEVFKFWMNRTYTEEHFDIAVFGLHNVRGLKVTGAYIDILERDDKIIARAWKNGTHKANYSLNAANTVSSGIANDTDYNYVLDRDTLLIYRYEFATAPKVTLNTPTNHTNQTTNSVTFNCTAWDDFKLENVSLILDGSVNETNSTEVFNGSFFYFEKILADGDTYWSCRGADNNSQVTTAGEFLININTTPHIQFGDGVPVNNYNSTTNSFEVNVTLTETYFKNITFDLYDRLGALNQSVTFTNASRDKEWTNLIDGDYSYNVTTATSTNQFNNTATRNITIDTTNPEVVILAPPSIINSHVLNTNIFFNWSANDTHLDACVYEYEGVNTTVTCSDNTTNVNVTNSVNRTITFYVNDTLGNINTTSTTWVYNFIETASSYSSSAYETNNETFKINVTTAQTVSSFSAFLDYNGTTYAADSSCISGDCEIEATIDIPLLNTGKTTENKTFFWRLIIFNSTGTLNINTSTNTQNISFINMSSYKGESRAVNFTIYKESDLTDLSADIKASFKYYLGGGSVFKTTNLSATSNTFSIYIAPNESFTTTSQIDLSATGHDNRRYDFLNEIYTNVTTSKSLYLSNSTFSANIIIEVRDEGLTPMSNVRVNISRYYPGTASWETIASQITDNFGQFVEKLVVNDVKYKFQFWNSAGTLLKTSEDIKIICRATICVLPFVIETTTDEFEDFEDISSFTSDLTYDYTTNIFTFSWNDQTSESIIMRLKVIRYLLNGSTQVCNTTSTLTLSTLTCDVGSSAATYKAQAYRRISGEREIRIGLLNVKANDPYATYRVEGLLWVFVLLFTCIGIGAFNPSVGVGLYGVGFIFMGVLGIISMPLQVFFANTLIVAIFIWSMKT